VNHGSKAEDFLFFVFFQNVGRANTVNMSTPPLPETHRMADWLPLESV
jgi:hypothetical protein